MSSKRGYQKLYAGFFRLCREFTDAREAEDLEAMRYSAEKMNGRLFYSLTNDSKEKAFDIFDLSFFDIEEVMNPVETEPIEETELLSLGRCFEIIERMENNYAA